jgi:methyl-accepting chemotaxis protein
MRKFIYPLILLSLLIVITVVGGGVAYNKASATTEITNNEIGVSIDNAQCILQLSKLLGDLAYKNFLFVNNSDLTPAYINGIKDDMFSDLNNIGKIISCTSFKSDSIKNTWDDFKSNYSLLKSSLLKTDIVGIVNFMQSDLKIISDFISSKLGQSKLSIINNTKMIKNRILLSLIIVVSVEILFVLMIFINALMPLVKLMSNLERLSSGKINFKFDLKHSGIFRNVVKNLISFKEKINTSFLKIEHISFSIKDKSHRIADGNKIFWTKINDISENEEKISELMNNMKKETTSLLDNTQHSLDIVGNAIELVNGTNSLMSKTSEAVENMFVNSRRLEEVFKFIDQITTQTNILAINASVEASKAGEYGKVFSIIAKDIRDLSIKTSHYAEESKRLINSNINNMETVKELSEKVISSFNDVEKNFSELTSEVKIIGKAIPDEHRKITEVSKSVNEITEILRIYVESIKTLAEISKELSEESTTLVSLSNEFELENYENE